MITLRMTAVILCATLICAACATQKEVKEQGVHQYIAENQPKLKPDGESQFRYYQGLYAALQKPPVDKVDLIYMRGTDEMISAASALRSGSLCWEAFDAQRRQVEINVTAAMQTLADQEADKEAARKQMIWQRFIQAQPKTTTCTQNGFSSTCTSN